MLYPICSIATAGNRPVRLLSISFTTPQPSLSFFFLAYLGRNPQYALKCCCMLLKRLPGRARELDADLQLGFVQKRSGVSGSEVYAHCLCCHCCQHFHLHIKKRRGKKRWRETTTEGEQMVGPYRKSRQAWISTPLSIAHPRVNHLQ